MTIAKPATATVHRSHTAGSSATSSGPLVGAHALAALRIGTGFLFLWAFLDKTFGLGYSTVSAKSWINGGSPTNGFLSHVSVGPVQGLYHSIAGGWFTNLLFMVGLFGIGLALMAGVAMRIASASGFLLVAFMYLGSWPAAKFDATGAATSSTNPLLDDHIIEALVLIVLGFACAGTTWGLGRMWQRLPIVSTHRWLQ